MKTPNYVFDDELYHHGIPGQRWGHRRFQNEDGSWTPEGRERYGEGDERTKAKATYNTQKYKADLKSKARQDKDIRAAKEERNRIKQAAKTERLARKEQAKIERKQAKLDIKTKDDVSLKNKLVRTKRYAMSDDELSKAIDRLKLEVEYNKQYALAAKPNGALARADRFFDGPTGKAFTQVAVATLPKVAETATKSILDSKLKYANSLDRDKAKAEIEAKQAETKNKLAGVKSTQAKIDEQKADTIRKDNESKAKIDRENRESEARTKLDRSKAAADRLKDREELKKARIANKVEEMTQFGYDAGDKTKRSLNWVSGKVATDAAKRRDEYEVAQKTQQARINFENAKREEELKNLSFKREQQEKNADLGRKIVQALYNDSSMLTSKGLISQAKALSDIAGKIKVDDFTGSFELKQKFDGIIPKNETSKSLNSALGLPAKTNVSESRIESMRSSGMTLREIAEKENVSTSTIADILYGKKKK